MQRRNDFLEAMLLDPFSAFTDEKGQRVDRFYSRGWGKCYKSFYEAMKRPDAAKLVLDVGGEGPFTSADTARRNRVNWNVQPKSSHTHEMIPNLLPRVPSTSAPPIARESLDEVHFESFGVENSIADATAKQIAPLVAPGGIVVIRTPIKSRGQHDVIHGALTRAGYNVTRQSNSFEDPLKNYYKEWRTIFTFPQ